MVSAWANQAGLSLRQVKTQEKFYKITAIHRLLEMLEIKGCIVSIDAMACQEAVAGRIGGLCPGSQRESEGIA